MPTERRGIVVRIRPLDMTWLEKIACADVPEEGFRVESGRLTEANYALLVRCDRCPVIRQCRSFHATMQGSRNKMGVIAGSRIYGSNYNPYWRDLTPREKRSYEQWQDRTGTRALLF